MKLPRHCLYNSGIKADTLDPCVAMIGSYFRIAFLRLNNITQLKKHMTCPEICRQNLSTQHLGVRGSKNSKGRGEIIQISQKEKLFKSHKKRSAIWG